ncbi:unnamed protein product [Rotaria sordida]|uniref:Protein kinase C n=1 Tax=Rotaria sordida TaxID=392033 RepID=A0A814PWZ3_9BILA|nr:unnamed protein product [Rotaria sordida]CAF1595142.1 unnamed protein product [Rotaria sordida]
MATNCNPPNASSSPSSSLHSPGILKNLRANTLSITLKFGFYQTRVEYPITDLYNSIIERLYNDAEKWLRETANNNKNGQLSGRFTIYLFRISTTEFTMVPIIQPSDIEQNSLIEIILVPFEMNLHSHDLYRCQLNLPTNCSKCSHFIPGLYKQGFRCRKCRMTYHRDCVPFLLDDCSVPTNSDQSRKKSAPVLPQLIFARPFATDSTSSTDRTMGPHTTIVPVYRMSTNSSKESIQTTKSDAIIDKGIFPACIRGANFYQRYFFCLTTNTLTISANLSGNNVLQQRLSPAGDLETTVPLTDIANLVLTHFMAEQDDIFEIHLRNKAIISVGKKSDSHDLQMETAQFYSYLRDQREALINTTLSSSSMESIPGTLSGIDVVSSKKQDMVSPLIRTKSIFRGTPYGKDNEGKDLHELYAFTSITLGAGAFGRVMAAYRKSTHREVAIKIMERDNCSEQDIRRINEEISNLYRFNHANILKLEAHFERDDAVYLVTERMETDLCSYITSSENGYLDEDICRMLTYQVIVALRYLHANNCGHLDVKCDNILLTRLQPIPSSIKKSSNQGENSNQDFPLIKLADFGYSRIIGEHSFRKTHVGTRVYNAPEIYHSKEGYNRLADMWSVGIVLYAALSGTLPFEEKDYQRTEEIFRDKSKLFTGRRWKNVSKDAIDLISNQLLVVQPISRIKSNDALFHTWFTDFVLYQNLREIEKRTKHLMISQKEEPPSPSTWLTGEREDLVWIEYQALYTESRRKK